MNKRAMMPIIAATVAMIAATGCTSEGEPEAPPNAAGDTPQASPGDWMAMYEQYVAQQTESLRSKGIEVPTDAEFVQFVEEDEWGTYQAKCMQDQGFEAEASDDGRSVGGDLPPDDQMDAHWQATYRCRIAYPLHPRFDVPMTDEQIRIVYDYFVDELVPCLEKEGYDIEPAPSWETFRSQWGTPESWEPHSSVRAPNRQEHLRIREDCPQRPPSEDVYGEPDQPTDD